MLYICIIEKRPVDTWATEHYCSILHNWFCSAAPIWNTRHELVGVLNVTLPWNLFHEHTRGMVESAAYAISEQLRLHFLLAEQRAIFEMMDEGVVILEDDGSICSINKKAQQMLALSHQTGVGHISDIILSKDILRAILSKNANFVDQEGLVQLKSGAVLNCMLSVSCTGEWGSRILTMREVKRIKESAARVTGAKAVFTFNHIIGKNLAFQNVIEQAHKAATSEVTTLILGESGTGKELFAQSMHNASKRATNAFITVNCGALPRELVQSELFGYDEGAFTGASRLGKPGKFELADNGTIFLDEIGEMPMDAQVSLLRLLQNGEVTRVGSKYTRHVNVRVIAATNRNLLESIKERSFREDLYYRLNVFSLNIPPLRERPSDIRLLIEHFLSHFRITQNNPEIRMTEQVIQILEGYSWPGNVRELENMVERMAFLAPDSGLIDVNIVPNYLLCGGHGCRHEVCTTSVLGLLEDQEKKSILKILLDCGGNIRAAASTLGISRSGLYVKMKKFGISPSQYR
jgi:transcriptional regulator with PAS, ATPase and Fis domain